MLGLWLLIPVAVIALLAACWWGSNIVFTPAHRAPLLTFPEQFELSYEKVSFTANDGVRLSGWLIPAAVTTDRTIVACHGWSDNKGDALARFRFLNEHFNLLIYDSRAHGESKGDFSTLGCLEAHDFDAARAFLASTRPQWTARMGVIGISMGAVVGVGAMARHRELKCAVLESPFRSYETVVTQFTSNNFHLPYFPFVWLTLLIIRWRLGRDPEPYSPTYHIEKIAPRPTLLISGENDRLMPLSEVQALHDQAGPPSKLWVIPGATHAYCQETAGEEYPRRITAFFNEHL